MTLDKIFRLCVGDYLADGGSWLSGKDFIAYVRNNHNHTISIGDAEILLSRLNKVWECSEKALTDIIAVPTGCKSSDQLTLIAADLWVDTLNCAIPSMQAGHIQHYLSDASGIQVTGNEAEIIASELNWLYDSFYEAGRNVSAENWLTVREHIEHTLKGKQSCS